MGILKVAFVIFYSLGAFSTYKCALRPDDDPTYNATMIAKFSNLVTGKDPGVPEDSFTGCMCPKSNPHGKVRYYCGSEIRPGHKQGDVCNPEGIYRCASPKLEAVMEKDCAPRKNPLCTLASCSNLASCIVGREKDCAKKRKTEYFPNDHGIVDQPIVN